MHYLEIPEKNLTLYIPENLGECDAKQYAEMAKLMYWLFAGQITYQDFKTLAVYALLNMKHHKKNANDEKVNEEIFKISELVADFFTERKTEDGNIQLLPKQFYIRLPKSSRLRRSESKDDLLKGKRMLRVINAYS